MEQDSGINVKHGCIVIPAETPRVFTSNYNIWSANDGAIARRMIGVEIKKDMRVMTTEVAKAKVVNRFPPSHAMFFGDEVHVAHLDGFKLL